MFHLRNRCASSFCLIIGIMFLSGTALSHSSEPSQFSPLDSDQQAIYRNAFYNASIVVYPDKDTDGKYNGRHKVLVPKELISLYEQNQNGYILFTMHIVASARNDDAKRAMAFSSAIRYGYNQRLVDVNCFKPDAEIDTPLEASKKTLRTQWLEELEKLISDVKKK